VIDLWSDGPPLSPAQLAAQLGVSSRYVRRLVQLGILQAMRLPNLGRGGRPELGRLRIPRAAARALAADLGMKSPNGNSGNSRAENVERDGAQVRR
jgi:hypothetical protein